VLCCGVPCLAHAEMASSNLQHDQLQREVKQLQALAAEKDGRLAEAAAEEQRLRQQLDQLSTQLQRAGGWVSTAAGQGAWGCAQGLVHIWVAGTVVIAAMIVGRR
jgi:septal ring factor EnvC (AmiA/AmiB activator)